MQTRAGSLNEALALDGDGRVMKGAAGRKKGEKVSVMFADGTLKCSVEEIEYGRI